MKLKINIKYSYPEEDVLEIGFYRGKTLLHNVFYDIEGLTDSELLQLKKEAAAKFASVFPGISYKDILKGFSAVDEKMYVLYSETFNPRGSGRKKGVKIGRVKEETFPFCRRLTKDEVEFLDFELQKYRERKMKKKELDKKIWQLYGDILYSDSLKEANRAQWCEYDEEIERVRKKFGELTYKEDKHVLLLQSIREIEELIEKLELNANNCPEIRALLDEDIPLEEHFEDLLEC